jgi:hypothetical protein
LEANNNHFFTIMKISAIANLGAVMATMTGFATAAPLPSTDNDAVPSKLFRRAPPDTCTDSTFENRTNGNSAYLSDCMTIVNLLLSRNEEWDVLHDQRTIAWAASCAFGVQQVEGQGSFWPSIVGGLDVADLIRDSGRMYGGGGRLAARGRMWCLARGMGGQHHQTDWGIYVSPWFRSAARVANGEQLPTPEGEAVEEPPADFVLHEESGVWLAPSVAKHFIDGA